MKIISRQRFRQWNQHNSFVTDGNVPDVKRLKFVKEAGLLFAFHLVTMVTVSIGAYQAGHELQWWKILENVNSTAEAQTIRICVFAHDSGKRISTESIAFARIST